jgi:hypothetical protein
MSYEVSVLWFKHARGVGAHWSIFILPTNSEDSIGTKHDCMCRGEAGRGFRWVYSALPNYQRYQSANLGGSTNVGTIDDLCGFERIMEETPLPILRENCQDWTWKVIRQAIEEGILDESAVEILATVTSVDS